MVRRLALKRGVPRKFQKRYAGPYEVFRRVSSTTYQVADLRHKRTSEYFLVFSAHVSQLKPWSLPCVDEGESDESEGADEESVSEEDPDGAGVAETEVDSWMTEESDDDQDPEAQSWFRPEEPSVPEREVEERPERPRRPRRAPARHQDYVRY